MRRPDSAGDEAVEGNAPPCGGSRKTPAGVGFNCGGPMGDKPGDLNCIEDGGPMDELLAGDEVNGVKLWPGVKVESGGGPGEMEGTRTAA